MAPPDIPANYYLDYFRSLTALVSERYSDILKPSEQQFLTALTRTSEPAQRLLIRLYLRKGPLFLADKLAYKEVENTREALSELESRGLIQTNPTVQAWELVELLPISESRKLFSSENPKIRKADLFQLLMEDEETKPCSDWGAKDHIVTPSHYDCYRRLQLLYFGNENQSLTEFVLEDLGLFQYEKYSIDRENRLFQSTEDIDQTIAMNDLAAEFSAMNELRDWHGLTETADRLRNIQPEKHLKSRWHRLANRFAYRLEQMGELDLALQLFESNQLPPSRERQVRILYKQSRFKEAHKLFEEIRDNPKSADERDFYYRFGKKIYKALKLPPQPIERPQPEVVHLTLEQGENCVELLACDHFEKSVWLENLLPLGVFGLIFWQVVFADRKGAWHHPFQSGPADLYRAEFTERRREDIELLLDQPDNWLNLLKSNWHQKQGIANPFVHWQSVNENILLETFSALSLAQWRGIFKHLLLDLRNHRSGFPDLFQITETGGRFIEIKGPGDKLQNNQRQWLEVFSNLGIEALVCYISYD